MTIDRSSDRPQEGGGAGALGIYLHVPFCLSKCPYCAFNSSGGGVVFPGYASAMARETERLAALLHLERSPVESLYFGGGTPSLLAGGEVADLLATVARCFTLLPGAEITLEVNPAAGEGERLEAFRRTGVNRLSLGVQSFDDGRLAFLGRRHGGDDALATFEAARGVGFENIGIDLIFGLPGEEWEVLRRDLDRAVSLSPEHLSLYLLTIEEGTPFERRAARGEFSPAGEERQEALFLRASEYLERCGYGRYETSNYARPGFESRHNLRYWRGGSYLGIGAGAHSYLSTLGWGGRWWNLKGVDDYMVRDGRGELPLDSLELLSRREAVREAVLTVLRTREGLEKAPLAGRFGFDVEEILSLPALRGLPGELFSEEGDTLRLTVQGALMADEIAARIVR